MGGLAAAAGPVGAALVVADMAAKKIAGTFDGVRDTVLGFGTQVASAASNDYLGMFKSGLEAIHSPLKDIPIVGQIYESELQAAIAPVKAFTAVVEAFNKRASELAGFSPDIAIAEQTNMVRDILDDIEEAQELGPEMARMVEAQGDMGHQLREFFLPVKKVIVDVLAGVLESLDDWMKDARMLFDTRYWEAVIAILVEAVKNAFTMGMKGDIGTAIEKLIKTMEALKKEMDKPKGDGDQFLRDLYRQSPDGDLLNARPRRPLGDAGRLHIPLIDD